MGTTTTSLNTNTFRMFWYTHVQLFILLYFDLHALHWRDSFYQRFFVFDIYNTTIRNNFCSSILIIALFCCVCVCVVCSFTQSYTLTQHIHMYTFDLLCCVSCPRLSNVLDRLIKTLKSSATKTRQANESSRARAPANFVLIVQLCGRQSILREQDS